MLQVSRLACFGLILGLCVYCAEPTVSQEQPPIRVDTPAAPGEIPKGVEVLARGPVHEAFAAPTTEPRATPLIAKKPPLPIEEMPPDEKPDGEVVWIGGYYSWDDDRADLVGKRLLARQPAREWVPGYWREVGANWQWVSGFWTGVQAGQTQPVTYYPDPPAPPNIAPPGDAPGADTFYVPGYWMWNGDRYVWRAGYWTRVRPGYVYVASHYRWTPFGHVFVAGYWDYTVARRGVLYAPIVVNPVIVSTRFVYTPYFAIRGSIVLDTMFVRPAFGAYYFGDYYGPRYVAIGFEPAVVYSRRDYEPLIVDERWHYRDNPRWHDAQLTLVIERNAGRAPVPPRTVNVTHVTNVTNVTKVNNITNINNVVGPTRTVLAAQGVKSVPLDTAARTQVRASTQAAQHTLAADRRKMESSAPAGPVTRPRTTALSVPTTRPVGAGGVTKSPGITHPPLGSNPTGPGKTPGITTNPPLTRPPLTKPPTDRGAFQPDHKDFKGPAPHPGIGAPPQRDKAAPPIIRPPLKKPTEDKKKGV